MTVAVRGRVPRWSTDEKAEQSAQHIQERLQALERALAGGAPTFVAPAVPIFGGGPVPGGGSGGGGGGGGGIGVPGVTDHGALTGLGDDDHPQYALRLEGTRHSHATQEIVGMDLYQQRGESVHAAQHVHSKSEIVDLRPDDEQFVIAGKMFGG